MAAKALQRSVFLILLANSDSVEFGSHFKDMALVIFSNGCGWGHPRPGCPGRNSQNTMKWKLSIILGLALTLLVVLSLARRPPRPRPEISVDLLGYTNRTGPFALLAITNRSSGPITLNPHCVVSYGRAFEGNVLRITQLNAHEGFVQEVFVFPAGGISEWRLMYYACHRSAWLDLRRSSENWWQKHVSRPKWPPLSKTWQSYNTDWMLCPN